MGCCCYVTWGLIGAGIFLTIAFVRWVMDRITVGGLHAKPVLITGCDTGFGHHLTLKCLRNGTPVFAACLTQQGVDHLKKAASGLPGTLEAFVMNVTDQKSVDEAVKFVESKTTGLWGLVNNAGIVGPQAPDDWLTVNDYEKVLAVNTIGVIRGTHAFRHLVKKRQGRIVTVASIAGRISLPTTGPYSVSKYAVEAYCDVLRLEMFPFGVDVSILEPGFFKTDLLNTEKIESEANRIWDTLSTDTQEAYGEAFHKETIKVRSKAMVEWADADIFKVVDAYYAGLFSRFPRDRYHVGLDSALFFIPLSMVPTPIQDRLLGLLVWFRGAPMPKGMVRVPFPNF